MKIHEVELNEGLSDLVAKLPGAKGGLFGKSAQIKAVQQQMDTEENEELEAERRNWADKFVTNLVRAYRSGIVKNSKLTESITPTQFVYYYPDIKNDPNMQNLRTEDKLVLRNLAKEISSLFRTYITNGTGLDRLKLAATKLYDFWKLSGTLPEKRTKQPKEKASASQVVQKNTQAANATTDAAATPAPTTSPTAPVPAPTTAPTPAPKSLARKIGDIVNTENISAQFTGQPGKEWLIVGGKVFNNLVNDPSKDRYNGITRVGNKMYIDTANAKRFFALAEGKTRKHQNSSSDTTLSSYQDLDSVIVNILHSK